MIIHPQILHSLILQLPPSASSSSISHSPVSHPPRSPSLSPLYNPTQITLITTSSPLPPSNLKLHIPSVASFQYAPVALCIPLLPACSAVAPLFSSPSSFLTLDDFPREVVGTRCWMMVLLMANLKAGCVAGGVVDSEIRDLRIAFCRNQGVNWVSLAWGEGGWWERKGQKPGKRDVR